MIATTTQIAAIYAFSTIVISMIAFSAYILVMFMIAVAVGYPLAGFLGKIKKIMDGPNI